jgi:tetratricopeptide (TPR) repeat protein
MNRPVRSRDVRWMYGVMLVLALAAMGCDDLDGRASNRKGLRYFRETKFIDAAANFERAFTKVPDDKIHYNLGLSYSRIFKPGIDDVILLAEKGHNICSTIPGVTQVSRRVCVKKDQDEEDRSYVKCSADAKEKDSVCPSSASCKEVELCAIQNIALVDLASKHLVEWIEKQPPDAEIKKAVEELAGKLTKMEKDRDDAEAEANKFINPTTGKVLDKSAWNDATQRKTAFDERIKVMKTDSDEIQLKFTMRKLMTQLWLDSQKFDAALSYWQKQLQAKPNDLEVMGNLAGINLKAGNWQKSIEWYTKVAEAGTDPQTKITAYGFIGNVAWSKLNSKTLNQDEAITLADLGIAALQKAHELAPKNLRFLGTQSSIYMFRGLTHGVSWAAAIDRASSQDLKGLIDVVSGKATAQPPPTEKPSAPASPDPKGPKKPAPGPGSGAGKKKTSG